MFEQLDTSANGRLRNIEHFRGTPKASLLSGEYCVFEVTQIQSEIRHLNRLHPMSGSSTAVPVRRRKAAALMGLIPLARP